MLWKYYLLLHYPLSNITHLMECLVAPDHLCNQSSSTRSLISIWLYNACWSTGYIACLSTGNKALQCLDLWNLWLFWYLIFREDPVECWHLFRLASYKTYFSWMIGSSHLVTSDLERGSKTSVSQKPWLKFFGSVEVKNESFYQCE